MAGFGFLSFEDEEAVNRCVAEHFVNLNGKQVLHMHEKTIYIHNSSKSCKYIRLELCFQILRLVINIFKIS